MGWVIDAAVVPPSAQTNACMEVGEEVIIGTHQCFPFGYLEAGPRHLLLVAPFGQDHGMVGDEGNVEALHGILRLSFPSCSLCGWCLRQGRHLCCCLKWVVSCDCSSISKLRKSFWFVSGFFFRIVFICAATDVYKDVLLFITQESVLMGVVDSRLLHLTVCEFMRCQNLLFPNLMCDHLLTTG